MNQPFRFLHASDLHLDRPLGGLADVPEHLRSAIIDAPYRAAERIFDAALKERVEFVVLSGDVIDPLSAGPRGLVFLHEQFRKLAEKDLRVYWAGGRADDFERWVAQWPLPDNVVRFSSHTIQRLVHLSHGQPLAQILGTSTPERKKIRAADFLADPGPLFTLAVAYGAVDADEIGRRPIHYWALGGEHDRRSQAASLALIHYPGTPQGRCPPEPGSRGCTLVEVDEAQRIRTGFISTDAVRYVRERLTVDDATSPAQLELLAGERIGELTYDPFGPDLLIEWTLAGSKVLAKELCHGKLAGDLAARLRAEHGHRRPAVWTVSIDSEAAAGAVEMVEEETLLGEFLRTVRHYVDHPDDPLSLESYLAERHVSGNLGPAVALDEPAVRRQVLAEVARLGVELLGPREAQP